MNSNKTRVRTVKRILLDLDASQLELTSQPDSEPIVERTTDKVIVGYLVQDADCGNPCTEQDGTGEVRSFSRRHINNISPDEAETLLESDPYVVRLSYFEHGLSLWDICGGKRIGSCPDMQWDGVKSAGVWIPDKCCREEIALCKTDAEREARAVQLAKECCQQYTAWCNGDCWGVCVDVFDAQGDKINQDSCWGYIGREWAEQELTARIQHFTKP